MRKDSLNNENSRYMAEKMLNYFKETKTYKKVSSNGKNIDSIILKLIESEQKIRMIRNFMGPGKESESRINEAHRIIIDTQISNSENPKFKKKFLENILANTKKFENSKRILKEYDNIFKTLDNYVGEFKNISYESDMVDREYQKMPLNSFLEYNSLSKNEYESERRIMRKFLKDDLKDIKHQKKGFTFRELKNNSIANIYLEWNKYYEAHKKTEFISEIRCSFFKDYTHLSSVEQLKKTINYIRNNKMGIARTMYINSGATLEDINSLGLMISEKDFEKIISESPEYKKMGSYGEPEIYGISTELSKILYKKKINLK